jgi:hypothetical protein
VPSARDYTDQHALLDQCVRGSGRASSQAALQRYFNQDETRRRYTGRWFERFAGGGDRPAVGDTVTAADVLALNFLSITALADFAVDTTTTHAERITGLLAQIPNGPAMHEVPWDHYNPESAATQLWRLCKTCGGSLRDETTGIDDISLLRCIDVILWMRATGTHADFAVDNDDVTTR